MWSEANGASSYGLGCMLSLWGEAPMVSRVDEKFCLGWCNGCLDEIPPFRRAVLAL